MNPMTFLLQCISVDNAVGTCVLWEGKPTCCFSISVGLCTKLLGEASGHTAEVGFSRVFEPSLPRTGAHSSAHFIPQ